MPTRLIPATPSAYPYPLLIKQLLHTPIRFAPDQEIVYRDRFRYSYRVLYDRIDRLASALSALGVGPGDTVAVLDWDSHRYLECFFAVPMLGAILHTVNIRLSPEQILYTMNHAEDLVVLVHQDFLPLLENISDKLKTARIFIRLADDPGLVPTALPVAAEYEQMLSAARGGFDFPEFDENSQATLFYTTGTTGQPKGVFFSHRQLVLHTLVHGMALGCFRPARFQSGDVYMPITPMFHVHAWGIPYLATLLGVKQIYPGRYQPEVLLHLIEKEGVTFSHCVPTILSMLLSHPASREIDLGRWTVNIGGAALSKGLALEASRRGIRIFAGYGMSETCPILTVANLKPRMLDWELDRRLDYLKKTGQPVPLVNLKIEDESGQPVDADDTTPGEIVVRAPWLSQGYFKDPEQSERLWQNGWLHTGDLATMDEEGYVQIRDRLKDVIKSGGEWISSLELESLISQHRWVSEVAVVGIEDVKWGERPLALVVPNRDGGENLTPEELRTFLLDFVDRGVVARWAVPDTFHLVEEIPKTSVGKIDKKEIRRRLARR